MSEDRHLGEARYIHISPQGRVMVTSGDASERRRVVTLKGIKLCLLTAAPVDYWDDGLQQWCAAPYSPQKKGAQ